MISEQHYRTADRACERNFNKGSPQTGYQARVLALYPRAGTAPRHETPDNVVCVVDSDGRRLCKGTAKTATEAWRDAWLALAER